MLQLILGRAGSGKTYRIREQVKQLAEQKTFQADISFINLAVTAFT